VSGGKTASGLARFDARLSFLCPAGALTAGSAADVDEVMERLFVLATMEVERGKAEGIVEMVHRFDDVKKAAGLAGLI